MTNNRQIYRIILQFMTYISIAVLLWVIFRSIFITDQEAKKPILEYIETPLQQLAKGELAHVLWQGKRISILHRNDVQQNIYYVFYDLGDSGNCPLFFTGDRLKDTCTGTQYNQMGKPIKNRADDLLSPPHYFLENQNKLMIGHWKQP